MSPHNRRRLWIAAALLLSSFYAQGHNGSDHAHETDHATEDHLAQLAAQEAADNGFVQFALAAAVAPPDPADFDLYGSWGPVKPWPHVAVSAANLPDGRILTWSSSEIDAFPGGNPEFTYATVWDPETDSFTNVSHAGHDMFCGHLVMLQDGRVFVNGGRNHVATTSIFDANSNQWITLSDQMNNGRWYPTSIALSDGNVLTGVGSSGGQYAELWEPSNGWRRLTGIDFTSPILQYNDGRYYEANWWPYFVQSPQGDVIHYGPTPRMHRLNTDGDGSITDVGALTTDWFPKHGASVVYEDGKVLLAGGAISGTNLASSNRAMIVDVSGPTPTVDQSVAPMIYPRKFANAIVLPNGEVLMVGGNTNGQKFNDATPVFNAEVWNPETGQWRELAPQLEARTYHSIALLMMDGRVLSAGGGLCGGCAVNHLNAEIYSPPYLFNDDGSLAARPEIFSAPTQVNHGDLLSVNATAGMTRFSLIKMSSTTHGVNTDQRQIAPTFNEFPAGASSNYEIQINTNPNVLTPGYYMLFALDSNGVPSVAKAVQITADGSNTNYPPVIDSGTVEPLRVNVPVSIDIDAVDIDDTIVTFSATGLPPGLTIDSNSGVVDGIPTQIGSYTVTITATDGRGASSSEIVEWTVGDQTGIAYDYYLGQWSNLPNFAALTPEFSGTVSDFDITVATVADNYGFRFVGKIRIDVAGSYTFYTTSDDGSKLWINGAQIVNNDGLHGPQERQGTLSLPTGFHDIEVHFFERAGGSRLDVEWSGPGFAKTMVPPGNLFIEDPSANRDPVIVDPGALTSNLNQAVSLAISATDPDPDVLQYFATGLPDGLSIAEATGLITGTAAAEGVFDVEIFVIDGVGGADTLNFQWTIIAAGPLALDPIQVLPRQQNTPVTFSASVSGGINPTLSWNFGDGTPTTTPSSSSSVVHTYMLPGRYLVTVTASSEDGAEVSTQFIQNVHRPLTAGDARSSSSIIYESRIGGNDRIWNANPDNDSVTVIDVVTNNRLAEIAVGRNPRAVALAANGNIWVTNRLQDTISVINGNNFSISQTVFLPRGSQPHGIVRDQATNDFWVALAGSAELVRIATDGSIVSQTAIGGELRHVSINAAGNRLYLPRFISPRLPGEQGVAPQTTNGGSLAGGEVVVVNRQTLARSTTVLRHSDKPDAENAGRGIPNYLGPVVISPDGVLGWVPSKQDNIMRGQNRDGLPLDHDNSVRSITSAINLASATENYSARLDHDDGGIASNGAFGPDGVYFYATLEGSRQVAMMDIHGGQEVLRIPVGRAPQGIAVSPDGESVFVHNFMDRSITRLDVSAVLYQNASSASVAASYQTVTSESLSASVLAGKQFFYDAFDSRLASQMYISCASCHNDGGHDGRVWDFGNFDEGLRNTIDLRGKGGMAQGPLHWSGNFDEVQDFENQIRALAHGTGLMADVAFNSGSRSDPLGDSKAGVSNDLDALAAYVASLDEILPSPNRNADGSFTSQALAGKAIFDSVGCADCHSGSAMTDSALNTRHNIGTLSTGSGNRLGVPLDGLDTPTLRGVWHTAPYLHNGSAQTLAAAVSAHTSITLTSAEVSDVAAYLAQLESADNDAPSTCGPVAYDAAVDRALLVWQECDGTVHVVGAGGNDGASYDGTIVSDQPFTDFSLHSVEASDSVTNVPANKIDFDITLGSIWVDEFRFKPAAGASACMVVNGMSAGSTILAGPNRTPVTSPFDVVTLEACEIAGDPGCGSPNVDRNVDAGLFVWKECGGPWSVMATGALGAGTVNYTGTVTSPDGFTSVTERSLESTDVAATDGAELLQFDIRTGHPWDDRFDFTVADDSNLCFAPAAIPAGLSVYAGADRTVMTEPFNPATLAACNNPPVSCAPPTYDAANERALFVWFDCTQRLHVLGTGASAKAQYAGHVYSDLDFVDLTESSIESSDQLELITPNDIAFDMSMGGPWTDEAIITPAANANLCIDVNLQSAGTSILVGADRTPVSSPFNPATLQSCSPPTNPECGDLVVDRSTEFGFFIWKDCGNTWHVTVTGGIGEGGVTYTGVITSSTGFASITPDSVEAQDTLSTSLTLPLDFSLSTGHPWDDSFDFEVADDAELCVTITAMETNAVRIAGHDRVPVGMSFNPVTKAACN